MGQYLVKATSNFGMLTDTDLIISMQSLHDKLLAQALVFPDPPITLVTFQTLITTYRTATAASIKGSKAQTQAKTLAKQNLIANARAIIEYINQEVWTLYNVGTITTLEQARQLILTVANVSSPRGPVGAIEAPTLLEAISKVPGQIYFRVHLVKKTRKAVTVFQVNYRKQLTDGVTPTYTPWESQIFSASRMLLDLNPIFTPASGTYQFQIAGIGGRNLKTQALVTNFTTIFERIVT